MPGAHLKNRENGRVVLHDGAKLDTVARVVAANDATVELGENTTLGLGTVINAGADVRPGPRHASPPPTASQRLRPRARGWPPDADQRYQHTPIRIGEDVWLGAGVLVTGGSRIGHGAVVSAGPSATGCPGGRYRPGPPGAGGQVPALGRDFRVPKPFLS